MGFLGMFFFPETHLLGFVLPVLGLLGAEILSMPYAMFFQFSRSKKMGKMGSSIFIVLPQIFAALGGGNILSRIFWVPNQYMLFL
ncbi:MAG: hypothetical protein CM15mP32_5960 [Flavobacteriaceae bacterium]|nr:MAG: hypothetical protein CM15mP32_5960 [Flavobacteriaceae bacterium]